MKDNAFMDLAHDINICLLVCLLLLENDETFSDNPKLFAAHMTIKDRLKKYKFPPVLGTKE